MTHIFIAFISSFLTLLAVGWWLRSMNHPIMTRSFLCTDCGKAFWLSRGETIELLGAKPNDGKPLCDECFGKVARGVK